MFQFIIYLLTFFEMQLQPTILFCKFTYNVVELSFWHSCTMTAVFLHYKFVFHRSSLIKSHFKNIQFYLSDCGKSLSCAKLIFSEILNPFGNTNKNVKKIPDSTFHNSLHCRRTTSTSPRLTFGKTPPTLGGEFPNYVRVGR